MSPAREHPAVSRLALEDAAEHRVAALSASLIRAVMITYGETNEVFAARVGLAAEVVAEALSGTCPAWALPYDEFMAIADAAEAMWPSPVFEPPLPSTCCCPASLTATRSWPPTY